jgi:hypothetical protein
VGAHTEHRPENYARADAVTDAPLEEAKHDEQLRNSQLLCIEVAQPCSMPRETRDQGIYNTCLGKAFGPQLTRIASTTGAAICPGVITATGFCVIDPECKTFTNDVGLG